jgi:hypothetical protein
MMNNSTAQNNGDSRQARTHARTHAHTHTHKITPYQLATVTLNSITLQSITVLNQPVIYMDMYFVQNDLWDTLLIFDPLPTEHLYVRKLVLSVFMEMCILWQPG